MVVGMVRKTLVIRIVQLVLVGPIALWLLLSGTATVLFLLFGTFRALFTGQWHEAFTWLLLTLGITAVFLLIMAYPVSMTRDLLNSPITITFSEDGLVTFRFFLWSKRIPAADILALRKVPYRRTVTRYLQQWWLYIDYRRRGKTTNIRFDASLLGDLFVLYGELKALNPAIVYSIEEQEKTEP